MPLLTPLSTPELLEGDSLTSDEFLRRWDAIPDLKRAELIDGIVYMPSPVSLRHQEFQVFLTNWVSNYSCAIPGCRAGLEGTWLMGERQVPQPDVTLCIPPESADNPEWRESSRPALPHLSPKWLCPADRATSELRRGSMSGRAFSNT